MTRWLLAACCGAVLLAGCTNDGGAGKPDSPPSQAPAGAKSGGGADEVERLTLEIERLKAENELLKVNPDGDKAGDSKNGKATLYGVEYEFLSLKMEGNKGVLRLAITSTKENRTLLGMARLRLLTANGTQHLTPIGTSGGTGKGARLIEGIRQEVAFDLGTVPSDIKEFTTIILPGKNGDGIAKAMANPVILKGVFKVER